MRAKNRPKSIQRTFLKRIFSIFSNKFIGYFSILLLFISFIVLWGYSGLEIHNFSLSSTPLSENKAYLLDFPGSGSSEYIYSAEITKKYFFQNSLKFFPDDCIKEIKVNSVKVDLSNFSNDSNGLCNYSSGIDINIEKYLHTGINSLQVTIIDKGGAISLKVFPSYLDLSYLLSEIVCLLFVFSVIYFFCRKSNLSEISTYIFLAGLCLYFSYFIKFEWFMRGHDLHGHIPYIEFLTQNFTLPNPNDCWECHQEPVYYIILAIFSKILSFFGITDKMFLYKAYSMVSLTFFSGYLLTGIKIIENTINKKALGYFAVFLFVFWPSNLVHSYRIGNDQLTYLFIALTMFFSLKYAEYGNKKDFYIAFGLSIVSSLIKLTALAVIPVPLLLLLLKNIKGIKFKQIFTRAKSHFFEYLLFLIFCSISFLLIFQYPIRNGFSSDWLTVNKPGDEMLVENSALNFTYIDIPVFIKAPNISTFVPSTGSEFFLHTLLKTSLFGEFQITNVVNISLAGYMSIAVLILCFSFVWNTLNIQYTNPNLDTVAIVSYIILLFLSLVYFRYKMPYTPNQDFRYILPILLPIIIACIKIFSSDQRRISNYVMIGSFITINLFSIFYFLNAIFGVY